LFYYSVNINEYLKRHRRSRRRQNEKTKGVHEQSKQQTEIKYIDKKNNTEKKYRYRAHFIFVLRFKTNICINYAKLPQNKSADFKLYICKKNCLFYYILFAARVQVETINAHKRRILTYNAQLSFLILVPARVTPTFVVVLWSQKNMTMKFDGHKN
jgi:hypothetical protein